MTETLVRQETLTAEEFRRYCVGRDGRIELVDGRVIEMPPVGPEHGRLDIRFARVLSSYAEDQGLGEVFLNTGFILRREPDCVRGPDEAFVSAERIAANPLPSHGFWEIAPDLVVEIISPDDVASDVNEKITDYLDAGCRLIWVFYPKRRQVHVFRADQSVEVLQKDSELTGDDVLPGFRFDLASFWR